jgi:hypothetical protein
VDAGDAVAKGNDAADFVDSDFGFVPFDLVANQFGDFVCFDLCHINQFSARADCFSAPRGAPAA